MQHSANSRYGGFCLFMTSSMLMVSSLYNLSSMNPLIPTLNVLFNSTFQERYGRSLPEETWDVILSLTVSTFLAGSIVGGVAMKYLLLIMSRKRLMQLSNTINVFGLLIIVIIGKLTRSYEAFIAGRFVIGISNGVAFSLTPLMVAEMTTKATQSYWQSFAGLAGAFGLLLGVVLGHPLILGNITLWPVLISLGALPSIIYLISSYWIPNTPAYLLRHEKKEEAFNVLKKLRIADHENIQNEIEEIQSEITGNKVFGYKTIFTTKQYRNQLIAICALQANFQLVGSTEFNAYSSRIFIQVGFDVNAASFATIGVFVVKFIAGIIGVKVVVRFGPLRNLIGSCCLTIFSLCLFIASKATSHLAPNVMPYVALAAAVLFMIALTGGLTVSVFALMGELTIEPTRPTIFAIGSTVFWISAWFVSFIPVYLEQLLGPYAMSLWLLSTILFLIYFIIFLPETKGKTAEEIQSKFK